MSRPSSDEELVCVSGPLCSLRLPLSPYTPCTPEPKLYPLEENTGYWSPDEIVELESSSDEEAPHPKKLITDYFTFKQMKQGNFPNFLKRFEPAPVRCRQENHKRDAIGNVQELSRQQLYSKNFLGSEELSLRLLRLAKLQHTNSSPISNYRRLKSPIFISRNVNYNINSSLRLRVGTHIIYIYIYIYIYRTSVTYRKSK